MPSLLHISSLDCEIQLANSRTEIFQKIESFLEEEEKGHFLIAINPEKIVKAKHDPELSSILQSDQGLNYPDGIGITASMRLLHKYAIERVPGVELLSDALKIIDKRSGSIFIYGASEEVNEEAQNTIRKLYPNLNIIGRVNGYEEDVEKAARLIKKTCPDLVIIALGSPLQEKWIWRHKDCGAKILMGVGGSLDVLTGKVKRAPLFFRKIGFEWFYRLVSQPSRISRQKNLPRFAWSIAKEVLGKVLKRSKLRPH